MAGKNPLTASEEQKAALGVLASSRERGEVDRARAILLTLEGWSSPPARSARRQSCQLDAFAPHCRDQEAQGRG
jgi:hypothetical protein